MFEITRDAALNITVEYSIGEEMFKMENVRVDFYDRDEMLSKNVTEESRRDLRSAITDIAGRSKYKYRPPIFCVVHGEEPAVIVDSVTKKFSGKKALDSVSFTAGPGEVVGLLGPNGSGKSTLMRIMLGFLKPDSGHVLVAGADSTEDSMAVRRISGYVPETVELYESLTPRELFSLVARVRGLGSKYALDRLNALVDAFELVKYVDTLIGALSKGNKQKVALVAAILHNPEVLFLDEPLTGLDAFSARVLKGIIRSKASEGGTVIFSTHVMEIAEKLCNKIVLLDRGRIVIYGTVKQVASVAGGLEELMLHISGRASEIEEILRALS